MPKLMFFAALLSGALCASSAQASDCAVRTGNEASLLLPASLRVSVNGRVVGAAEISAHTPSGDCAGRGEWTGSATAVTIWGDDTQTAANDGFQPSEPIGFRVRDTASGVEYNGSSALITISYEDASSFYRTDGLYADDAMYRLAAITVLTAPTSPTSVSPSDGASDVPVSLVLAWSDVPRAEYYDVEIATDQHFTNLISTGSFTAASFETSALANGASYFWRVRARNAAGASHWSSAASFTTIAAAPGAVPQLSAPGDGAADQPRDLTLAWVAVDGADHYRVELSASTEFSTLTFEADAVAGTSVAVSALAEGQRYYWRVRAVSAGGNGPWSAQFEFTTALPPPAVPASPAIVAADVESGSVALTWSASPEADSYVLQVATMNTFDPVSVQRSLADTSIVLTDLTPGTKYFWRVQTQNEGVSSAWSSAASFTTIAAAPGAAPQLSAPGDGAAEQPRDLTLAWGAVDGADRYRVELSANAEFSALTFDADAVAGTSVRVSALAEGQHYYWRVRAANAGGVGPWSATFYFTTAAPPPAVPATPSIVAADVESGSVALAWSASAKADSYVVQLAETDAFDPLTLQRSLTDTSVVVTELKPGTKYFWRVQAQNRGVSSAWSAIGTFETRPGRPSSAPGPVRPTSGSVMNSTEVTFSWAAIDGASNYRLRIYEDEDPFPHVVIDSSAVTGTELVVPLAAGKSYAWDVQAMNAAGEGPWTTLVRFSLSSMSVTGRNEHDGLPNSVTIHPNYPNPFNPSTTIPFDVPQAMPVRIAVYDVAGAEQAVLIDSNVAAGRHEVSWAADGFPSGTYFCRIEAGGVKRTVTLLLIK